MNNKIVLSITVASLAALGSISEPVHAEDSKNTQSSAPKVESGSGKCASGKCGTEKIYAKVETSKDPQGQLVMARDGKCGMTAEGHDTPVDQSKQLAEGICGQ